MPFRLTSSRRVNVLTITLAIGFLLNAASPAMATTEFGKVFLQEYIKGHSDKKFAKFVKRKVRCYVCHQGKKNKHENIYGQHLAKLLDHETDKKEVEKIVAALKEVGQLPFDPKAEKIETFAERIANSKMPGGDDLDELKKEPEGAGEEDFVSLFDGKTLEGWINATDSYEVRDGVIASLAGKKGNLFTEAEYSDFVLRFEFLLTPGANNGLGIRTPLQGDVAYLGIEIQVLDNSAEKYKDLKEYQLHGSAYGVAPAKKGHLKSVGEWNQQEIRCEGRQITVVLNGETILDVDLDQVAPEGKTVDGQEHPGLARKSGHVGFLGHDDVVEFRNIRILEIEESGNEKDH